MKSFKILFIVLILLQFAIACNKDSTSNAKMEVRLTDGPAAYNAVNIDIQSVEVHNNNKWVTISPFRAGVYNLLNFSNGLDTILGSVALEVGTVDQIRLVLGANNTVVESGVSYALSTPSAMQSGLKLNVNQQLEAGKSYVYWLDFDASRSIVKQGNGGFSLKPVIRTFTTLTNGRIQGTAMPLDALSTVLAIKGTDTFGAIPSVTTGGFLISGLSDGSYSLIIDAANPLYRDTIITGVNVTFGNITNVGTIQLSK